MKKRFYTTGVVFGIIFDVYLLIVVSMIQSRNENITAFAFISGLVPLISGIGCISWLITCLSRYAAKEVSLQNYKLPVMLTMGAFFVIIALVL